MAPIQQHVEYVREEQEPNYLPNKNDVLRIKLK
jgi:hypothetical protein